MANRVVKIRREAIAACMTCPICDRIFRDATTISECLHTFCRKCIHDKISDEELENCPVCNIDLGCSPLEKLRPDHSLQDVRAKIFPSKRRKVKAPEPPPSVALPVRRKERSLSSLVVSTPKVSLETAMTGRRAKGVARKASSFRNSGSSVEKPVEKEELLAEGHPESSSSPEIVVKFITPNTKQSSSLGGPVGALPGNKTENGAESWGNRTDRLNPLDYLVEVANRTKHLESVSQASVAKVETPLIADREAPIRRNKRKPKAEVENQLDPAHLELERPKKVYKYRRKATSAHEESGVSSQAVLSSVGANHERKFGPVWFSLVASVDQEGDAPLPQIPASYLRVKDGNVPVSYVQKYLAMKLNLAGETEVEIRCMGQPVSPSLQLYHLVDLWRQTTSSQRMQASIGLSAKDFVMVLSYSRKL